MSNIAQGEANGIRWTVESSPADKRFAVVHLYRDGQKINFHVFGPETVPAVQAALTAYHAPNSFITIPMAAPDSGEDSAIYAAKLRTENADLRATVERLTREVAALRLMLREVASTNSTGIDHALKLQADLAAETATRAALRTQESRIMGILADAGVEVGDVVRGVEALAARARWSRLWHAEARRLWRMLADAEPLTAEETEQCMRELEGM